MKYLQSALAIGLISVCATAGAVGPRFASVPSSTSVTLSNPNASPGQTVQVSAKVTASALGLYLIPSNEALGGYVDFYANGATIGRVRVSASNTAVVGQQSDLDYGCYAATRDVNRCTYRYVYGREANVSVNYSLPAQFTSVAFTASFTGDSNFSAGSTSAPAKIDFIPTFGSIRGMGGKCLDAEGANTGAGTAIQVWDCSNAPQQLWTIAAGSPYIKGVPSGRTLDVVDLGTSNGSRLQLWDGLNGPNQAWKLTHTSITGIGNKVLDAVSASSANGTRIQLYTNAGTDNQKWNFDPVTGQITGTGGKCLDVEAGSTADGALVQLWDCTNVPQQRFVLGEGGTIRGIGGKCLESANGSDANTNPIRMWTCNGQPHQSWRLIGHVQNPASGRCLADPGRGAVNGAKTYIWDCSDDENQTWEYSSY
jgi:hypothetical protein